MLPPLLAHSHPHPTGTHGLCRCCSVPFLAYTMVDGNFFKYLTLFNTATICALLDFVGAVTKAAFWGKGSKVIQVLALAD